jgi:hypothetical protein
LFDKEIESNEYLNEAAYRLYTKFIDDLSDFVDQQGEVIRTRLHVQEKRQELKRLRQHVSQCDMLLIDYVRTHMTDELPCNNPELIVLFEGAQTARDQAGPLEADYEPLEVNLGAEEYKLKEQYAQIEKRFEHFFRLNANPSSHQSIPSRIQYDDPSPEHSATGDGDQRAEQSPKSGLFHGALVGGEVGVGQVPMVAGPEYFNATQKNELEARRNMTKSSDTQDHSRKLRSSATGEEKGNDELPEELLGIAGTDDIDTSRSLEIEPRDRRMARTLNGVASHSLFETIEDPGPLPDEFLPVVGLTGGDSLLLLDESSDTRSKLSDYLRTFENTRDRVNRWILYHLRVSPREVYALQRCVVDISPGTSDWADLALAEWPYDKLGYGESYYYGSIDDDSDMPEFVQSSKLPHPEGDPLDITAAIPGDRTASHSNIAAAPTASDLRNFALSDQQDDPQEHPSGYYGSSRLMAIIQRDLQSEQTSVPDLSTLDNP